MSPYSPIEPFAMGHLDVGDGHRLYYEVCGNPEGQPAVVLHGGPGSGCTAFHRRYFDPTRYRVVLFDQRNCGRSTPRASDPHCDLATNSTSALLSDIEALREHLDIESWLVWGYSWGVTLGLVYAETFPERVSAMVLGSVTLTRPRDIFWLYHDVGRYLPEQWSRFRDRSFVGDDDDLVRAYDRLLNAESDSSVREEAARRWCEWEDAVTSLEPGAQPSVRYEDPLFRLTFARVVTHYFSHAAWLGPNQILENTRRLERIPAVLVHGRFDLGGPLDAAWLLKEAWPAATLRVVDTGHRGGTEMTNCLVDALDSFAS